MDPLGTNVGKTTVTRDAHCDTSKNVPKHWLKCFTTSRGSRPGSPLADLAYNILMSALLKDLEAELRAVPSVANTLMDTPPVIVWVDDLALPIPCLLASELDNTVQDSLLRVQLVFKKFGLQLNFNPGKTEANLHYCGSGAPDLRRQRFVEGHGILPISHHEDLRIVSQFSHLGIVLAQNCNMGRDIQHRLGKAASAYRSMSR